MGTPKAPNASELPVHMIHSVTFQSRSQDLGFHSRHLAVQSFLLLQRQICAGAAKSRLVYEKYLGNSRMAQR